MILSKLKEKSSMSELALIEKVETLITEDIKSSIKDSIKDSMDKSLTSFLENYRGNFEISSRDIREVIEKLIKVVRES